MRIEFEAFGEKIVAAKIERVGHRSVNMQPIFVVMAKRFYRREKELFLTGGLGLWDRLKAATVAAKARSSNARTRSNSPNALRASDVLMKSLTQPNARYSKRTIRGTTFDLGTSDPKAIHHYWGAPRAGIPARPPIMFLRVDKVQWVKDAQSYVIAGKVPAL